MKKLAIGFLTAGVSYLLWLKVESERQNQVVWTDVTDEVPTD